MLVRIGGTAGGTHGPAPAFPMPSVPVDVSSQISVAHVCLEKNSAQPESWSPSTVGKVVTLKPSTTCSSVPAPVTDQATRSDNQNAPTSKGATCSDVTRSCHLCPLVFRSKYRLSKHFNHHPNL